MAPKSYQIAHIYCLFFLMVVVCLAGWFMGMQTMLLIDEVTKCVKDHKRCLYKFGKK